MFHRTLLSLWLILGLLLSACVPAPATAPAGAAPAADTTAAAPADGRTVAILVVDKFTKTAEIPVKNMNEDGDYPKGEGCVVFPSGKAGGADYISRGGGGSEHGRLVWSTITKELHNGYQVGEPTAGLPNAELWTQLTNHQLVAEKLAEGTYIDHFTQLWEIPGEGFVRLVPVDIGDFDTATVAAGITNTLNLLAKHSEQIDQVIINMSWVILPANLCTPSSVDEYLAAVCRVMNEQDQQALQNLAEIRALLDFLGYSAENDNILDVLCSGGATPFDGQPGQLQELFDNVPQINPFFLGYWLNNANNTLLGSLQLQTEYSENGLAPPNPGPLFCLLSGIPDCDSHPIRKTVNVWPEQSISIGAAGNDSLKFPFMPGLWDSVVSVGATDENGDFESYSNWSEVILNGVHPYANSLLSGSADVCEGGFNCSLYEGYDRVVGTSYAAPRLSILAARYLLDRDEPSCPTPPLGYNQWDNLTIEDAANQYCQDFPLSP